MIVDGFISIGIEPVGDFAGFLAIARVDDDLPLGRLEQVEEILIFVIARSDDIADIGPIKTHADDIGLDK